MILGTDWAPICISGGKALRIGFSLPVSYLTGKVSCELSESWTQIYGPVDQCLGNLKNLGITSVEISRLSEETPPSQLRHAVEVVIDASLGITVHGWLPKMEADPDIPLGVLELEKVLIECRQQDMIPFTVHSHESDMLEPKSRVAEGTLRDLNLLAKALAENSVFMASLEICRRKDRQSVGVTFVDTLFMAKQIGRENLGLCWDVGHSQANYHMKKDTRLPDEEFAKNVIHAHIHDVGPDGRTHWPVLVSDGYVRDCIDILRSSGYEGVYNLELSPFQWRVSPKECRAYVETSINSMARMLS